MVLSSNKGLILISFCYSFFIVGANMVEDEERIKIIEQLLSYKLALEKSRPELLKELGAYYSDGNTEDSQDLIDGFKDLEFVSYKNSYEAYLLTQIKMVEIMPQVINEHIFMLNVGDDIDQVLEDFELEVYYVKKDIYSNLKEWETLLDHMNDERLQEITSNPKGHGDRIIKELNWIKKFEQKNLI